MPSAFYDLTTGIISGTVNPSLSNPDQIAALLKQGTGVIEVAGSVHGANSMVDLASKTIITLTPSPPIPDINLQGWAALIKKGIISASDFHPATVADINTTLTAASVATVS